MLPKPKHRPDSGPGLCTPTIHPENPPAWIMNAESHENNLKLSMNMNPVDYISSQFDALCSEEISLCGKYTVTAHQQCHLNIRSRWLI